MENIKRVLEWIFLLFPLMWTSCTQSDEERICHTARQFAELYYNLNVRDAREYCNSDLHAVMDFRMNNLTQQDYDSYREAGPAKVKVISCNINYAADLAYVKVEVRNFLRFNYISDSLLLVECDTIDMTLSKVTNKEWKLRDPF